MDTKEMVKIPLKEYTLEINNVKLLDCKTNHYWIEK